MKYYNRVEERVVNHVGYFNFPDGVSKEVEELAFSDEICADVDVDTNEITVSDGAVEIINDFTRELEALGYTVNYDSYDGEEDVDFHAIFHFTVEEAPDLDVIADTLVNNFNDSVYDRLASDLEGQDLQLTPDQEQEVLEKAMELI